jgi:biopolymer transport protein TolR
MSDINMTPLIDVMLVLVVILLITAPLLASSIKLDLPQTDAAKGEAGSQSITVAVDALGKIYVMDQVVTLEQLAQQFAQQARLNNQTEVLLRADRTVPYGRIVEVMGAAQQAGLNHIGFVAETNPTPARP